jgi:hypothetical protein
MRFKVYGRRLRVEDRLLKWEFGILEHRAESMAHRVKAKDRFQISDL